MRASSRLRRGEEPWRGRARLGRLPRGARRSGRAAGRRYLSGSPPSPSPSTGRGGAACPGLVMKKMVKVKKKKMKVEDEKHHQACSRLWSVRSHAERGKAHLLASGGKGPQGADGGEPGISRALIGSAQVDRSVLSRLHLCPTHALSSRAYVTHRTHRTRNTTRGRVLRDNWRAR